MVADPGTAPKFFLCVKSSSIEGPYLVRFTMNLTLKVGTIKILKVGILKLKTVVTKN